ncbi:Glucuronoxylanase XynC precursor [compost metagenome]
MKKFDLGQDKKDVIPVLKEILAINPKIKILGSPWSPPTWMKTNNDTRGGSLKPEWYQAYALYLVKYVQAMKTEGINIYAITVQNEPLHPGNNPSLLMLAPDQAIFVKTALGPAFEKAGIKTKIILYDHNCDRPDYPISIMNDPEAKKYVDGSAFHLYGGKIDALTEVHNAHPDKNLYFTEQWVGAPGNLKEELDFHIKDMIIGAPRNWSRTVLEWNISNNPQNTPYTDRGGCDRCLGAVTIDNDKVTRNPAYYTIAHAAKFVRPGSVRIASNTSEELPNVAYKTPSGKYVVIAYNNKSEAQTFNIRFNNQIATLTLDGKAAATYVW